MGRRRKTAAFVRESLVLTRGAAHVLEVLKARHADRDEIRVALRYALEFEASLVELQARLGPKSTPAPAGTL